MSEREQSDARRLSAGRVGRAHGLDGSFYVTRPLSRVIEQAASLTLAGREYQVVRRAGTSQRPILRLAGIETREQIEPLRGQELTLAAASAPSLAEGEWWAHELEGCEVLDGERRVGVVQRMLEMPSCEVLEVRPENGGATLLVPMVKDAVREIDTSARTVQVNLDFIGHELTDRAETETTEGEERS